jgi:hypothetical protein
MCCRPEGSENVLKNVLIFVAKICCKDLKLKHEVWSGKQK